MKTLKLVGVIALSAAIGFGFPVSALATDFVTTQHGVTVSCPEVLSISSDTDNFTLTFTGFVQENSETDTKTVTYTVQSNNMRQADGQAAININLDADYADPLQLLADVGDYTLTSGNTELAEQAGGFVQITKDVKAFAKKDNTTEGTEGKLLNGTIPIVYKAKATGELATGDYGNQVFVTLTTI